MFHFHLLIGLIRSTKYLRVAYKLVPVLKAGSSNEICFYEILPKIKTKEKRLNFLNTEKTRFRKNFDFRWIIVILIRIYSTSLLKITRPAVGKTMNFDIYFQNKSKKQITLVTERLALVSKIVSLNY